MKSNFIARIALLLGLLLLAVMVSNDSLWLDEGDMALYAIQPDFHSWLHYLRNDVAADCQMPLSMFCAWVGGKTLGTAEWQLRAINVIWGALALLGMYRAGKRLNLPWLPLLLAMQPYFWFYMNEARPYAAQIAGGAWLLAAFVEFISDQAEGERWAWVFSGAMIFLCLATMLAPVPILAVLIAAAIVARSGRWQISRKSALILIGGALANIPIGIYYASTLARGAKGAQLWRVDFKFFGYVIYEFTGMTGLGLAIDRIRELARSPHLAAALAHNIVFFVLPAFAFVALAVVLLLGLRKPAEGAQAALVRGGILVLGIGSLIFVAVGLCIQKAFWARHFAPLFPFYAALLGMAVSRVWTRRLWIKCLAGALICLLCYSALNLRFAERHRKEDYREAARIAKQMLAEHKSIWWLASPYVAQYYDLNCALTEPEPGKVYCPQFGGGIEGAPAPDAIIYSKGDIYDPSGAVHQFIEQNGYHAAQILKSFVIYARE